MIPYLGFIGWSGSGKTTLLEQLITQLIARGYRVAVVKHTHHRHVETDLPGKDTRRLWDIGAVHTVFLTPDRIVHTRRYAGEPTLEMALGGIDDVDLVLVEGYKGGKFPKIEVVRAACDPDLLPDIQGRIACVTDVPGLVCDGHCLALDDIAALADFVESWLADVTGERGGDGSMGRG